MPSLSKNFDARAAGLLLKIEAEDAQLKQALYSKGRTRHIETPIERARRQREIELADQYRQIFYTQFQTTTDFAKALSSGYQASDLRNAMLEEAKEMSRGILPIAAPGQHTVFTGSNGPISTVYRDFDNIPTLSIDKNGPKGPISFVTIERGSGQANVCLSHVPGAIGATPTNFIAEMADTVRQELMAQGYKGKNINFFIHVPRECANTKEILAKVEFEHTLLGGWKLKEGHPSFDKDTCLNEMPAGLAHSLKPALDHSPATQQRDSLAQKANAYRRFLTGLT